MKLLTAFRHLHAFGVRFLVVRRSSGRRPLVITVPQPLAKPYTAASDPWPAEDEPCIDGSYRAAA
jgi:hypothetical protein